MQDVFSTLHKNSVAGIGAALAPDNDVGICGKGIDYLTLAFVTPLQTYYCYDSHRRLPSSMVS